jgi:hypothetical protein
MNRVVTSTVFVHLHSMHTASPDQHCVNVCVGTLGRVSWISHSMVD